MANSIRDLQRNIRREERSRPYRRAAGTISGGRLISCYGVSAVIVALCIYEIIVGDDIVGGNFTYILLAAAAVIFSAVITIRNNEAKGASSRKKHKQ